MGARSARLAFEKSPRPVGRSPRPNLPYTRTNKRLHLALKKHADRRDCGTKQRGEDRGNSRDTTGDGLKEVEERCSPMPVTLISAAGHAALFHYCPTILVVPVEEEEEDQLTGLVGEGRSKEAAGNVGKRRDEKRVHEGSTNRACVSVYVCVCVCVWGGWIGTEVVDALGQTHLPLKQARRHACFRGNGLLSAAVVVFLPAARGV